MEYTTVDTYYETTIDTHCDLRCYKANRQDDTTTSWDLARIGISSVHLGLIVYIIRLWSMYEPNGTESVPVASS
jgi:hypothetical protein